MLKRGVCFLFILVVLVLPVFAGEHHEQCSGLSGQSMEYCIIFNEMDSRMDDGNRYIGESNDNGRLGWGRGYMLSGYLEMYKLTENDHYLDRLVEQIDDIWEQSDEARGVFDYSGESKPGWSKVIDVYGEEERVRFLVHSGHVLSQILEFVKIVYEDPGLHSGYGDKAEVYLANSEEVAAAHDVDWYIGPDFVALDDEGYYRFPDDAPLERAGYNVPHNRQTAMGSALVRLYEITGNSDYKVKAKRIGRMLKRDLDEDSGGAYIWRYWAGRDPPPGNPGRKVTDFGHGSIDVRFAKSLYEQGWLFGDEDMEKFTKTFTQNIFTGRYDEIAFKIDGTKVRDEQLYSSGRWLGLGEFDKEVYDIVSGMYEEKGFHNGNNTVAFFGYAQLARLADVYGVIEDSRLEAYYNFEGGSKDLSDNGLDGDLKGNPGFSLGMKGNALYLDGENDYIDLGDSKKTNPRKTMSVLAWVKPNSGKKSPILERYSPSQDERSYYLRKEGSKIRFQLYGQDGDATYVISEVENFFNVWTHIAVTYEEKGELRLYINGGLVDSEPAIGRIHRTHVETTIGGVMNSNSRYFDGAIDDLQIYSRTLSEEEILSRM